MKKNAKYSHGSFKRQDLSKVDPAEFNDTEIVGSCFYQETHHSNALPDKMTGVVFRNCNLDNCIIPKGATVNGGTNKHIQSQKDGEYWIVGVDGLPIEPRDKAKFIEFGISIAPQDLPAEQLAEPITVTNDPKVIEQKKIDAFLADEEKVKEAALADAAKAVS